MVQTREYYYQTNSHCFREAVVKCRLYLSGRTMRTSSLSSLGKRGEYTVSQQAQMKKKYYLAAL